MDSVDPQCNELKKKYDDCFNSWFTDQFLKGSITDACSPLFTSYQECIKKALKKLNVDYVEVNKDVLGSDKEKVPPPPPKKSTKTSN